MRYLEMPGLVLEVIEDHHQGEYLVQGRRHSWEVAVVVVISVNLVVEEVASHHDLKVCRWNQTLLIERGGWD